MRNCYQRCTWKAAGESMTARARMHNIQCARTPANRKQ